MRWKSSVFSKKFIKFGRLIFIRKGSWRNNNLKYKIVVVNGNNTIIDFLGEFFLGDLSYDYSKSFSKKKKVLSNFIFLDFRKLFFWLRFNVQMNPFMFYLLRIFSTFFFSNEKRILLNKAMLNSVRSNDKDKKFNRSFFSKIQGYD